MTDHLSGPRLTARGTLVWSDPLEPSLEDFDAAIVMTPEMFLPDPLADGKPITEAEPVKSVKPKGKTKPQAKGGLF